MQSNKNQSKSTCDVCGGVLLPSGNCPTCLLNLAHAGDDVDTISQPAFNAGPAGLSDSPPFRVFGDYELIEEIARGGMGVVYKARQISLNRMVVVKMIHGGLFASRDHIERFQYEARATSKLTHPHIVPIHDVGEHKGQHFFTMKLFEKGTLADCIESYQLPSSVEKNKHKSSHFETRQNSIAKLMATVAHAVHYAHQQGVIHRDLKPSNILMDSHGEPHVGDFSLAKMAEEESGLTLSGAVLGTPAYMSPEQAKGEAKILNVTTDVYGLGAILYHLLTGSPPFSGNSSSEILKKAAEEIPHNPRMTEPGIHQDLETICLKCLSRDPEQRYQSALEVSEELERFLNKQPIKARPINAAQKLIRWCQRRPVIAALVFLLGVVGVTGFSGVLWQRNNAIQANTQLKQNLSKMDSLLVDSLMEDGDIGASLKLLTQRLQEDPNNQFALQRALSILETSNIPLPAASPVQVGSWARSIQFSPDQEQLAVVAGIGEKQGIALDMDLRTFQPPGAPEQLRIYNTSSGQLETGEGPHAGRIDDVHFSPDGLLIATASWDKTVKVWDTHSLELYADLQHEHPVWAARFNHDSNFLVTVCGDMQQADIISLWDMATLERIETRTIPIGDTRFMAVSPNQRLFAVANQIFTIEDRHLTWLQTTLDLQSAKGSLRNFGSGTFTPDNSSLLYASENKTAQLFDVLTGKMISKTSHHSKDVRNVNISPSGHLFVTTTIGGMAQIWMSQSGKAATQPIVLSDDVYEARFSPYGNSLATASKNGTIGLWDSFNGEAIMRWPLGYSAAMDLRFYDDGKKLAAISADGTLSFWDIQPSMAWPDRGTIENNDLKEHITVVNRSGKRYAVQWSIPYAIGTHRNSNAIHIFDESTRSNSITDPLHPKRINSLHLAPSEDRLVTASDDGTAVVWDIHDFNALTPPLQHNGPVTRARFSQDSKRIVTASMDGFVRLWDAESGLELLDPIEHPSAVTDVRFSNNDEWFSVGCSDGTVRVWNSHTGNPISPPLPHQNEIVTTRILPDKKRILVGTTGYEVRLWNIQQGIPLSQSIPIPILPAGFVLSEDGVTAMIAEKSHSRFLNYWEWMGTPQYKLNLQNLPTPVPSWFAAFLTVVAEVHTPANETPLSSIWQRILDLQRELQWGGSDYHLWCQWFLSDRKSRPVNPDAKISVNAYQYSFDNIYLITVSDYRAPVNLIRFGFHQWPRNYRLYARFAQYMKIVSDEGTQAHLMAQHSTYLGPDDTLPLKIMAETALNMGNYNDSLSTIDKAIQMIDLPDVRMDLDSSFGLMTLKNKILSESRIKILEEATQNAKTDNQQNTKLEALIQVPVKERKISPSIPNSGMDVQIEKNSEPAILGMPPQIVVHTHKDKALVKFQPTSIRVNENNNALKFNGFSDIVQLGPIMVGDGDFTIETWILPLNQSNPVDLISNRDHQGDYRGQWFILRLQEGKVRFYGSSRAGRNSDDLIDVWSQSLIPSSWTHVAVVKQFESIRIYINGKLDSTHRNVPNRILSSVNSNGTLGGWRDLNRNYYHGTMDEIRIWTVAKKEEEIQSHMNRPLTGTESGLIVYYSFDHSMQSASLFMHIQDFSKNHNHGVFLKTSHLKFKNIVPGAPALGRPSKLINDRTLSPILHDIFPLGKTPVIWTLTDGNGEQVTQEINVNVVREK